MHLICIIKRNPHPTRSQSNSNCSRFYAEKQQLMSGPNIAMHANEINKRCYTVWHIIAFALTSGYDNDLHLYTVTPLARPLYKIMFSLRDKPTHLQFFKWFQFSLLYEELSFSTTIFDKTYVPRCYKMH